MAIRITANTSLINLQNLDDNAYLKNRLKYHAASRIGIQTGQSLAQAGNTDGHTVRYGQVWTALDNQFIVHETPAMKTTTDGLSANIDLVALFCATGEKTDIMVESTKVGEYWTNASYPAIRLYKDCEMSPVAGSNGSGSKYEAYEFLFNGNHIMDWVAPTSVKDNGLPVPGYTARIEATKNGSTWTDLEKCTDGSGAWALAEGNWEFAYISGMCTFHPSNTPAQYSYTKLRITAFAYVGDYLNDTLNDFSTNVADNMMAIKPFEFSINGMEAEYSYYESEYGYGTIFESDGEGGYRESYDYDPVAGKQYYRRRTTCKIVLPAVVFNVFNKLTGISYGDIEYLTGTDSGKTQITFEDYESTMFDGNTEFIAYGFVRGDGGTITVLETDDSYKN